MANLRNHLDSIQGSKDANNDVFNHIKKVAKSKADYDTAKLALHTKLAPTRQLLEHIDQAHPLNPNGGVGGDMNEQDDNARTGMMEKPGVGRNSSLDQVPGKGMQQQPSGQAKMNVLPGQKPGVDQGSGGRPKPSTSGDKPTQPGPKQPTGSKASSGKDPNKKIPAKKVSVKVYGGSPTRSVASFDPRSIKADYHDDAGESTATRAIGANGKCMKCKKMKADCKCKMSAGGPGSGRKPVNDETHKNLTGLGYKQLDNYKDKKSTVSVYRSKDDSHEIHVRPTGRTRLFKSR